MITMGFTLCTLEEHFKRETEFSTWLIKPLGGFDYHLALSIALWNDNNLSVKRKLVKPFFVSFILKKLMKKRYKRDFLKMDNIYRALRFCY
jgi:hypothetical protein